MRYNLNNKNKIFNISEFPILKFDLSSDLPSNLYSIRRHNNDNIHCLKGSSVFNRFQYCGIAY